MDGVAHGDFPAKGHRHESCLWFDVGASKVVKSSKWQDLTRLLTSYCLEEDMGKSEGSQGCLAASQDFCAMVKVRHEQKVLSSGHWIGLQFISVVSSRSYGQDPDIENCKPSTSLLRALPESPHVQRDPWRRYDAIARPRSLSLDGPPPSSLLSPLQYFLHIPPLSST